MGGSVAAPAGSAGVASCDASCDGSCSGVCGGTCGLVTTAAGGAVSIGATATPSSCNKPANTSCGAGVSIADASALPATATTGVAKKTGSAAGAITRWRMHGVRHSPASLIQPVSEVPGGSFLPKTERSPKFWRQTEYFLFGLIDASSHVLRNLSNFFHSALRLHFALPELWTQSPFQQRAA